MVYSGDYVGCQEYFGGAGMRCPEGYNLADYLSECFWLFIFIYFLFDLRCGCARADVETVVAGGEEGVVLVLAMVLGLMMPFSSL